MVPLNCDNETARPGGQPDCGHFDSKTWPLASSVDLSRAIVCAFALLALIRCQTATFHLVIRSSGVAERALLPSAEQATQDTCRTKAAPCCKSCLDLLQSSDRHGRDRVAAAARELVCDNGNAFSTSLLRPTIMAMSHRQSRSCSAHGRRYAHHDTNPCFSVMSRPNPHQIIFQHFPSHAGAHSVRGEQSAPSRLVFPQVWVVNWRPFGQDHEAPLFYSVIDSNGISSPWCSLCRIA